MAHNITSFPSIFLCSSMAYYAKFWFPPLLFFYMFFFILWSSSRILCGTEGKVDWSMLDVTSFFYFCVLSLYALSFCASLTRNSLSSLLIMSTSRILPPFSDKIQEPLDDFRCFIAIFTSSSMLFGTHKTTPSLLSALWCHGWKGYTVHFFFGISSVDSNSSFAADRDWSKLFDRMHEGIIF